MNITLGTEETSDFIQSDENLLGSTDRSTYPVLSSVSDMDILTPPKEYRLHESNSIEVLASVRGSNSYDPSLDVRSAIVPICNTRRKFATHKRGHQHKVYGYNS